jgi:aspartate racemase
MSKIVGILGGMGPMSTVDLMRKVTEKTPVKKEQEHLRILVDSRPQIPDRTAAILGEGPSPAPVLQESARLLEQWGAQVIAIPCNSAHAFLDAVREAVGIEVLDMIGLVGRELADRFPKGTPVGLLATTGSGRARLYHNRLPDFQVLTPAPEIQQELVMGAIYQVKVEDKVQEPRRKLLEAAATLDPAPAALIAGCTEVELALEGADSPIPIFCPMDLLAQEIVDRAWRSREP